MHFKKYDGFYFDNMTACDDVIYRYIFPILYKRPPHSQRHLDVKALACQGEEDNTTNPYAVAANKTHNIQKISIDGYLIWQLAWGTINHQIKFPVKYSSYIVQHTNILNFNSVKLKTVFIKTDSSRLWG